MLTHQSARQVTMTSQAEPIMVLRVEQPDGSVEFPAAIPFDRQTRSVVPLMEAQGYLGRLFPQASISVEMGNGLRDLGVPNPEQVPSWSTVKSQLNEQFLERLAAESLNPRVIQLVAQSLDLEKNLRTLEDLVNAAPYDPEAQQLIGKAQQVARIAHMGQVTAREQDASGLFHVPYVNHCVAAAIEAVRLGARAEVVETLLLHDVKEDTGYSHKDLAAEFPPAVMRMVDAVTRQPEETRADFMERVSRFEGELQIVKALDRYNNMLRSFGIEDPAYLNRLLDENRTVYHRFFEGNSVLKPLRDTYFQLQVEMERRVEQYLQR